MTRFTRGLVMIATAADRAEAEAMLAALDLDGRLTVNLSATGAEPATHYGVQCPVPAQLTGKLTNGPVPGWTAPELAALRARMVIDVSTQNLRRRGAHDRFRDLASAAGLRVIGEET